MTAIPNDGLIPNEAFVAALKGLGLVPESTTSVSIHTTGAGDGYVRMVYDHVDDDDGSPTATTTRLIEAHARALDRLNWSSLLTA